MWRCIMLAAALAAFAAPATAAIIPVGQSRALRSFGNATTPDESDSDSAQADAADFGRFEDLVGHAARAGAASSDGFASQTSWFNAQAAKGTLAADAFVSAFNIDDSSDGGSSSSFDLDFQVDVAAQFKLYVTGSATNNGFASIQFTDPNGQFNAYWDVSFEPSAVFDMQLVPGETYRLAADASASGFLSGGGGSPDGQAGMSFTLRQVPEPSSVYLACVLAVSCAAWAIRQAKPRVKIG